MSCVTERISWMAIRSKFFRIATITCITSGSFSFDSPKTWMLNVAMRIVSLPRGGGACAPVIPDRPGNEIPFQPLVWACCSTNQPRAAATTAKTSEVRRFMGPSLGNWPRAPRAGVEFRPRRIPLADWMFQGNLGERGCGFHGKPRIGKSQFAGSRRSLGEPPPPRHHRPLPTGDTDRYTAPLAMTLDLAGI